MVKFSVRNLVGVFFFFFFFVKESLVSALCKNRECEKIFSSVGKTFRFLFSQSHDISFRLVNLKIESKRCLEYIVRGCYDVSDNRNCLVLRMVPQH